MAAKLGKKGMFLTFISIAIIAAAIIIFTPSDINLKKDIPVIKSRASNVNEYVLDLENVYLENTLKATGRRTIIALIKFMESQQQFLTDFNAAFSEVLLDGKINGVYIDTYYPETIMTGKTYRNYLYDGDDSIKSVAKKTFNVDTYFGVEVNNIRVYQIRPWFVEVEAGVSFNTTSETASWNKTATIKTEIQIEGFNDPYYLVKTGGSYKNIINKSGTKFDEWNVEKVKDFIRNGNYTHFEDSNAPNFLMRFTNDFSPSPCCSIESLVNPNHPSITDKDVSYVDYLYWSTIENCNSPPYNIYTVNGITGPEFPNFKLDFNHLAKYKLSAEQQLCPPTS